jgi:hypothetical protein
MLRGQISQAASNFTLYLPIARSSNQHIVLSAEHKTVTIACPTPPGGQFEVKVWLVSRTATHADVGITIGGYDLFYRNLVNNSTLFVTACGGFVEWAKVYVDKTVYMDAVDPAIFRPMDLKGQGVQLSQAP